MLLVVELAKTIKHLFDQFLASKFSCVIVFQVIDNILNDMKDLFVVIRYIILFELLYIILR